MKVRSITEARNISGKKVLLRLDCNVPLRRGKIVDDYKIVRSLQTIEYLVKHDARVIILSHLGRPSGPTTGLSLRPVKRHLEKLLNRKIIFLPLKNLENPDVFDKIPPGAIGLLENIRFLPGEAENRPETAKLLSRAADLFVLDGFAVAHRAAASVSGVAKFLPSYAGLLLAEEVSVLSEVLTAPKHPLVVILGGNKLETKVPILKRFLKIADYILISGGIFNAYLLASGDQPGGDLPADSKLIREIKRYGKLKKVIKPVDVVVGEKNGRGARVISLGKKFPRLSARQSVYDIGPATVRLFAGYLKKARTLLWNGPMGYFEQHPYEYGNNAVAQLFAARSKGSAFGVAGGGETVEVLRGLGVLGDVDLVSTGGGAMLEFLGGKKLPGIEALRN